MPDLFFRKANSWATNVIRHLEVNSTILKVIWTIEIRSRMLLIFEKFLGHKSLNLGLNCIGPRPIEKLIQSPNGLDRNYMEKWGFGLGFRGLKGETWNQFLLWNFYDQTLYFSFSLFCSYCSSPSSLFFLQFISKC